MVLREPNRPFTLFVSSLRVPVTPIPKERDGDNWEFIVTKWEIISLTWENFE